MDDHRKSYTLKKVKQLLGMKNNGGDDSLRDAIEELIDEEKNDTNPNVALHERLLISNILELRDMPVTDVMVPRADIVAAEVNTPRDEFLRLVSERPHNRIPIYQDGLDHIIGVIYLKDVLFKLATQENFHLREMMHEPLMVSPAMRVLDLLLQLRQSRIHIAFVVDEFGGIDGLITINDLVEAVVGEIDAEHHLDLEPQFIERPDGSVIADARYDLEDLEDIYGNIFFEDDEDEDIDTLGGLIMDITGYMPARGEIVRHASGVEFEIIDADPRRINRVRIRNLPPKKANAEG